MKLFLITFLTMAAFAANSLLTRLAISGNLLDSPGFAAIRLMSGAAFLCALVLYRNRKLQILATTRVVGVLALATYVMGFTLAYTQLDAGLGALILFGSVQITMFGGALATEERIPPIRWFSMAAGMVGLGLLLWPTADETANVSIVSGGLMVLAGLAWGVYSLAGRAAKDPLEDTASNFLLAVPIAMFLGLFFPMPDQHFPPTVLGICIAIIAGAITSGLGYALWYTILPKISATQSAIAQLAVPVLAMLGGVAFLGEEITLKLVVASVLVLGSVSVGLGVHRHFISQ